ncbi:MAG: N-acetylmuramoyl-L-alanine amidase [Clostridia bacterium]|nr:N-acetylmuramoyl-L-alanine amidase [Clostridia bacterium]
MKKLEKHKRENKFILVLVASLLILLISVGGIYFLLANTVFSGSEDETSGTPEPSTVSTPSATPVKIDNIDIEITEDSVIIKNISENYSFHTNTNDYYLMVNIAGRNVADNQFFIQNQTGIVENVSASAIGEDAVEMIIRLNRNFNFDESFENKTLTLTFYTSINDGVFTYRNDTVRKYITINQGKLSTKDVENRKFYQEDVSENGLIHKLIISNDYISKVKDEKLVINDDYLNYISIYTEGNNRVIEFNAKKPLIYYTNTRDYDATITLIEPDNNSDLIFIDAGHGGSDGGAYNGDVLEKDVNLKVAIKTYELLSEAGYNCYLLRENDEYVGLNERADIANLLNASVYVNIHSNSYDDKSVNGILVMYKDEEDLARTIQNNLISATNAKDMGLIHTNEMLVTNKSLMPAVIVEMGFITNDEESKRLSSDSYQDKLALGLKNGIIEYLLNN